MDENELTGTPELSRVAELPDLAGGAPEPEDTGERFLPGTSYSAEMAYDHLTRYRLAERYVADRRTVDLGSGVGYGSYSLARVARSVVGVDLSEEAVSYAAGRYRAPNLRYELGSVTDLPHESGSFEAAVAFEVIEHLERPEELVLEAKRVLKEDGLFVVSTPDKQTYSNARDIVNPHHLSEMYPLEFRELLEGNFGHVQIYWQGAIAGSVVTPDPQNLPEDGRTILESAQFSLPDPAFGLGFPIVLYMIAVCTDGRPPEPLDRPHLILDRDRQIYEAFDGQRPILDRLHRYHDYELQMQNRRLKEAHRQVRQARHDGRERARRLRRKADEEVRQTRREADEQVRRVRRTANKEVRQARRRARIMRRRAENMRLQVEAMQNSRTWKIANKIKAVVGKARNVLRRRR